MVTVDEFWPKSVGAIRSITMEVVTAIFALWSCPRLTGHLAMVIELE